MTPGLKISASRPKKATSSETTTELGQSQAPNRTVAVEHENEKNRSVNGGEASILKIEDCREGSSGMFTSNEDHMEIGPAIPQPLQTILDFDGENGTPKNSGSKKLKRSVIWDNFTLENNHDGSTGARCKQCQTVLSGNKNSGTGHLFRHAKFHCKGVPNEVAKSRKLGSFSSRSQATDTRDCEGSQFSQESIRRLFTQLLICVGLPFEVAEHPTFIHFVKSLQPSFEIFNQETVKSDCIILYEEQRKKVSDVLKKLDSRLNISYALWSSDKNVIYMAVTAHYIDDNFSLKKNLLNFRHISCLNMHQIFNEEIVRCIAEWSLNEKVFAVTSDSSSINCFLAEMGGESLNEEQCIMGNYSNVKSCENILNIMALDGINILDREIGSIRKIIIHVNSNASNLQKFNEIAQQFGLATRIGLVIDVSRKWDATTSMLQSALPYKEAINKYYQVYCNSVHDLSEYDWEKLETLTNILKAFVNANNVMSNTKSTANLYFKEVWTIRSLLYEDYVVCDDTMMTLTLNMQQKFSIYWNQYSLVLAVAVILDPRYKFLFIQFCYENVFDNCNAKQKLDRINEFLHKLYHDYEQAEGTINSDHSHFQDSSNTAQCVGKRKIETEFAKFLAKKARRKLSKNDLDMYLDADVHVAVEDEEFDVLKWWKTNAVNYPILSKMARDILAIPISTAASKLAFSSCKRFIDQHSIHLDSSTLESLICTQAWLNADYHSGEGLFEDCMTG